MSSFNQAVYDFQEFRLLNRIKVEDEEVILKIVNASKECTDTLVTTIAEVELGRLAAKGTAFSLLRKSKVV